MTLRTLKRFIGAEGALVVLALMAGGRISPLIATTPYLLPTILGIGALLALRFRRSRALFASLLLGLATFVLVPSGGGLEWSPLLSRPSLTSSKESLMIELLAVLIPLDLGVLALSRDRGLFTRRGLVWLGGILLQIGLVILIVADEPSWATVLIEGPLLPDPFRFSAISDPGVIMALGAFGVAIIRLHFAPDPITRGLAWSIPATTLALAMAKGGRVPDLLLATAGLIIVIGILEATFTMAYHDDLTGLPSRRAFNEGLLRLGSRYTIAMIDIDHFKRCNDRHGHHVGDQVLRMVATRVGRVGGGGKPFRYGGEEFAIIFAGRGRDESLPHLEDLRRSIGDSRFVLRGADRPKRRPKRATRSKRSAGSTHMKVGRGSRRSGRSRRASGAPRRTISVSVSIGAAERSERHPTPEVVLEAADRALYCAKRGGRNRVVL